jgi:hypothetical protein
MIQQKAKVEPKDNNQLTIEAVKPVVGKAKK